MEQEQQRRTSKIIFNQALNQNHKSNRIKKGEKGPHTEAPTAETIYDSQSNILSFTLLCSLKKLKTSLINK